MDDSINILPGDIEGYCLGLLSEEDNRVVAELAEKHSYIQEQIDEFISSLENFALANAIAPPVELKEKVLNTIINLALEEGKDINQLPFLNKYSNYNNWLQIVQPLLPEDQPETIFVKQLRNDGKLSQILMWAAVDYPEEVHHDEEECFLVLQGRCRCFVGDESIELGPGDFLDIPLHHNHNVKVLEPVIAVVQRRKVA
jgi:mannose-6-phosphate isomerase-like protein (cupin superfamily)